MPHSPLKIALVSEHASPLTPAGGIDAGGQNIYVRALAEHLAALGHDVTVYTRRTSEHTQERVPLRDGARVDHVPMGPAAEVPKEDLAPFVGEMAGHLRQRWRDSPPDIVHAHYWMSGAASLAGTRRTPIPVVQTFHARYLDKVSYGPPAPGRHPERERERERVERPGAEWLTGLAADAVIALTGADAARVIEAGTPPSRVAVVPCGVDPRTFTPDGPARPRSRRPRLVSVGRLVARKGITTILEALATVPDAELVLAGGPLPSDEARRLMFLADELGIADRVTFLGAIPHEGVPALLRSADVYVTAPWYEPFGMAALEAVACGVPVVATAVGGLPETVIDGVNGLLVPPANSGALAAAIGALLFDTERRATLSRAAASHARGYSWERVTREILDVYERVVSVR